MSILGYPLGWIMWAIYKVVNNYGVALILFTVLVRLALFPLSVKQQKSSAKMQVFQPKMQEIQKKYANNKEKQQEEMMKLYEQHGYNPMAGCLPSIIQMILLFGMQRPDVLSYDDLAIRRGLRMVYRHRSIDRALFEKYRRRYSPYGSVASLYLWAAAGGAVPGLKDYAPKKKAPAKKAAPAGSHTEKTSKV